MFETFLLLPLLLIIATSIIFGTLGTCVLWHRLTYFGDALAHAMLLAIAISLSFDCHYVLATLILVVFFVLMFFYLSSYSAFNKDNLLAIVTYTAVALAIIIRDLGGNIDFNHYFFGEIFAVTKKDIYLVSFFALFVLIYVRLYFKKLLILQISRELSQVNRIASNHLYLVFLFILAINVAILLEFIGIFLTTALLIMPASIARCYAKTPSSMIIIATLVSLLVSLISFALSVNFDLTLAAVNVAILSAVFFCSLRFLKL